MVNILFNNFNILLFNKYLIMQMIIVIIIIAIIIAIILFFFNKKEGFFINNSENILQYSPNDKVLFKMGIPSPKLKNQTFIQPGQIGFSQTNYINRNTYSDIYNGDGDRRTNPIFRYVTRAKGYEVLPARFSEPDNKFYRM
jgi:magnesium-transporting ATPase (P-type)